MFLIRTFAIIALALFSNQLLAQDNSNNSHHYFEFGLAGTSLITKGTYGAGTSANSDLSGGIIKYGYDFNNWFSAEAHLGATAKNTDSAPTYTVSAQTMAFVGARFSLRYDHFTIYALAGGGYGSIKESTATTDYTTSKTSAAYGLGMDFYGSKTTSVSVSLVQYVDSTEVDLSAIELGIRFYFDKPTIKRRY